MGMYTQLHIGTRLKKDISKDTKNILDYMVGNITEEPKESIAKELHGLFKSDRWHIMLRCDSYYFDYKTHQRFDYDDIGQYYWFNVTSNLKNYNNEIALFLDWLYRFIDEDIADNEFLGYYRYGENKIPNMIFKGNMIQSV